MLPIYQNPFPVLESKGLVFRELKETDASQVFKMRSNPEVMKYIGRPVMLEETEALEHINLIKQKNIENDAINWAICEKNQDTLIGIIGFYRTEHENFRTELGYMLMPEFHNKGYVSEAIPIVMDFAFKNFNLHSIHAIIDARNVASERVLMKCNFRKEGVFKEHFYINGKFFDSTHFGILKSEFEKYI